MRKGKRDRRKRKRKEEEEVALVMEKMIKKIEKENEIPLTHSEYCKKWRESFLFQFKFRHNTGSYSFY